MDDPGRGGQLTARIVRNDVASDRLAAAAERLEIADAVGDDARLSLLATTPSALPAVVGEEPT